MQIFDSVSSFAKSSNKHVVGRLIELGFVEQILLLLTNESQPKPFYRAALRCLRSFFLSKKFSNPYLTPIPFILLCDQTKAESRSSVASPERLPPNQPDSPVDILFATPRSLDTLRRLLTISKATQIAVVEILCCACVDKDRQKQIVEKGFAQEITHLLVQNMFHERHTHLVR